MNKSYTREELDRLGASIRPKGYIHDDGDFVAVNGALGMYELWYPKNDKSVLPCLTGEIGGMPGAWENWITAWHTKNFSEFDVYMDIGANGGYFSGLAATYGLEVFAVEANPVYADCLEETARINRFDNFTVLNNAVSDSDGQEVDLVVPAELHGGASIAGADTNLPGESVVVETITLNSYLGDPKKKHLVKMDIEGAEEMAFDGANKFNKNFNPTYIIEYTPRHYKGDFFAKLEAYGRVTMVDFSGNEVPITKDQANSYDDWITLVVRK